MSQQQTVQQSAQSRELCAKLEQLTMEEQQEEQDLRRIQEKIRRLEQRNQTK